MNPIERERRRVWLEDTLQQVIRGFEKAERFGEKVDEPEGVRYIRVSDTLAKIITKNLVEIRKEILAHEKEASQQ